MDGSLSVAEVGRRCGYPRPSHFVQVFKVATSVTPGQWEGTRTA